MITNTNYGACTSCFSINISDICCNFVIKYRQIFFIYRKVWFCQKRNFKFTFFIGFGFSMRYFLRFRAVSVRSVPIPPSRILYFSFYTINHFGIGNICSCIGNGCSFNFNLIIQFKSLSNFIEFCRKFRTFILFYAKTYLSVHFTEIIIFTSHRKHSFHWFCSVYNNLKLTC